jgi:hypothetical protein
VTNSHSILRPPIAPKQRQICVTSWRPFLKNTLIGFAEFTLPSGLVVKDCTVHQKGDRRWVSFPGRPYERDGKTEYVSFLTFNTKERSAEFQSAALEALDTYLAHQALEETPNDIA